jgi:hypothetical protein
MFLKFIGRLNKAVLIKIFWKRRHLNCLHRQTIFSDDFINKKGLILIFPLCTHHLKNRYLCAPCRKKTVLKKVGYCS